MKFIISAQEDFCEQSREIGYRNAASGAYYSVLYLCQSTLEQAAVRFPHEGVITTLTHHPDKQLRVLGQVLRQIKDTQVHADYKPEKKFTAHEAQKNVDMVMAVAQKITAWSRHHHSCC